MSAHYYNTESNIISKRTEALTIATLVIGVNREVHPHAFVEGRIVISEHMGEIARPVKRLIGSNDVTVLSDGCHVPSTSCVSNSIVP